MAQVISHYAAKVGGSSTMYYYAEADDTSKAVRIYTGTAITLPADYASRLTKRMYPTIDPGGWIFEYYIKDITPVYMTVTDACTPPESVTLNAADKTLTITGGDGGDLNTWTGFGLSWRERKISSADWGEWSGDSVIDGRTATVEAGSGMVRQFRVRTLGEAGEDYFSDYVVCDALLVGNTAAGTPVVLLPVSGTTTFSARPVIKISCPPDADGDSMTLQRSLDDGPWMPVGALTGEGGPISDRPRVSAGSHTVRYCLMDTNGEGGGEDSVTFVATDCTWKREIQSGDIIANREISFVSDILELLERVNTLRTFYGLPLIALPGTVGRVQDWRRQLAAMQTAVNECRRAISFADHAFDTPSGWPDAQQINQLREAIANT